MQKFIRGDKVIPIGKTTGGMIEHCQHYKAFKSGKVPYLFVKGYNSYDGYTCSAHANGTSGNYYNEKDLLPYIEGGDYFSEFVRGRITEEAYIHLKERAERG